MPKNKICRTQLPNGCSVSQISVIPKNWKQAKKITGPWRVFYSFYDPAQPKPIQVSDKKMNAYKDLAERKAATEMIIDNISQALQIGYNPFYKKIVKTQQANFDIEENTLFIPALKKALQRVSLSDKYRKHIGGYVIPSVEKAAIHLGYHVLFISEVKRKHIIFVLDHLREINKGFSDNTFNRFRTDLKILFKELTSIEAIETNPIDENLQVKQLEQKEKKVLSEAERIFINDLLLEKYPSFHRFLHIFFHSGARETELMKVKVSDVDLDNQRFKVIVLKGKKQRAVWKVIKTIALPYWVEQLKGASENDFVFSRNLLPGEKSISAAQITKRWYRLVKKKEFVIDGKKTKITADFYSLKHLHSTEVSEMVSQEAAAEINSHTSTAMVKKIYDINFQSRENKKLQRLNNKFA